MYLTGQGVKQNIDMAQNWFSKACDNGIKDGCRGIEALSFEKGL